MVDFFHLLFFMMDAAETQVGKFSVESMGGRLQVRPLNVFIV